MIVLFTNWGKTMKAVKKIARRLKDSSIDPETAAIFKDMIQALHVQSEFQLTRFYQLNYEDFDLALSLLTEWRLQRYTMVEGGLIGLMQEASKAKNTSLYLA